MGTLNRDHLNMMISGEPNANLFNPDDVHLNDRGISQLAASNKISVHDSLGVQVQHTRNRSRSGWRPYNRKSFDLLRTCTFIL